MNIIIKSLKHSNNAYFIGFTGRGSTNLTERDTMNVPGNRIEEFADIFR